MRAAILVDVLLFALLLAVVAPAPQAAPPPDWRVFRLSRTNNAVVPGSLRVSWRIQTGGSFSASPTVHGDRLFIGNNAGELLALDVRSGALAWSAQFPASLMAAPIVWHDTLFVGEGNQVSYQDRTGDTIVGNGENELVALDARDGRELWQYQLDGTGMPSAAIVDGTLVHHDGSGKVVGLDPESGAVAYVHDIDSFASMSAAIPTGRGSFVTTGEEPNAMYRIDAHTGRILWRRELADSSGVGDCPPASDGITAYCDYLAPLPGDPPAMHVGSTAVEHAYAVRISDGALLWDRPLERGALPEWNEAAIPLLDGRHLILGSSVAPRVCALDARTGARVWCRSVRGAVKGGIVAVGDALYFGDLAGYLWALDARDGSVLGVMDAGTPFNVASPVVVGQTLVIGSKTGALLAVPLDRIRNAHDP